MPAWIVGLGLLVAGTTVPLGLAESGHAVHATGGTRSSGAGGQAAWLSELGLRGAVTYWTTPDPNGHQPFLDLIDRSHSTLFLEMFHLDDPKIVQALIAAKKRGVDVKVILNGTGGDLTSARLGPAYRQLLAAGVEVRGSSPKFSITHTKAMIADGKTAIISSINLTNEVATTRDHGVRLEDESVIAEMQSVFDADWANAEQKTRTTPPLSNPNLIWSPVDSRQKLVDLIGAARQSIALTVENLGDPDILAALAARAKGGVHVRVMVPMCDKNANPTLNYPYLATLAKAGVQTRVMPYPDTAEHPYMHAKMILVDPPTGGASRPGATGPYAYIGSVNFSNNSTTEARELGIVLADRAAIQSIQSTFTTDWAQAQPPSSPPPTHCPKL
jgi:phosphatidylserine/phosphatidylglycerophosphate/cardiolipin synthase-like enzyme